MNNDAGLLVVVVCLIIMAAFRAYSVGKQNGYAEGFLAGRRTIEREQDDTTL